MITTYRVADGRIHIASPYCDAIVATCRSWGGKFVGGEWTLPAARLAEVQEQLGAGVDDLVEVEVKEADWTGGAQISVGWYVLAARRGRDNRPDVYADLVEGRIPGSGGSVKSPRVQPSDDAKFRLWVPRDFAIARRLTIVNDPRATAEPVAEVAAPVRPDRLARVEMLNNQARERNRQAMIPDMDLGDRHQPCDWFAQLGFFIVLEKIGRSQPEHDWSDDGGNESDRQAFFAARALDHQRVADWLRQAAVEPILNRDGADVAGIRCMWCDRIPALKVWAGQQTLPKMLTKRQKALPQEVANILACEAPIGGASGIDGRVASTAIEDGFSADALKMLRATRVGTEMLAVIGLESLPITVYPDGALSYRADDSEWRFHIEDRNDYYGRIGTAERMQS